jgi:hypothetical protein
LSSAAGTPHKQHHHHGPRNSRNIGALGADPHLEGDDPDFSGVMDFSNAIPGPGGSWCITKTKYVDHMVKDEVKECWHQNITQCHDTYITEFLPTQEQKCEESFWKSCKIDFREMPYNYTMKQCHIPLMKVCDSAAPSYEKPEIVCRTWFQSECNTTFAETTPNVEDKPSTWCKKVPRKICAPDNCRMVPGAEECNSKMLMSTVQKPTELCDLQPQQHCRLVTKLTPHLISKEVCRNVPKEVCHMALSPPKNVRKPITLKWCTRKKDGIYNKAPTYKPNSYLPPPPPLQQSLPPPPSRGPPTPGPIYASPQYPNPSRKPFQNLQTRSDGPSIAEWEAAAAYPLADLEGPIYVASPSNHPEPLVVPFKPEEAVVAYETEREEEEKVEFYEAASYRPQERITKFPPPSAKLLQKLREKKLKKDSDKNGSAFKSVLQEQVEYEQSQYE